MSKLIFYCNDVYSILYSFVLVVIKAICFSLAAEVVTLTVQQSFVFPFSQG